VFHGRGRTEAERHAMSTTAVTDQGTGPGTYGCDAMAPAATMDAIFR